MPDYKIVTKKIEPQLVASVRDVLPAYSDIGQLYGEIFKYLGKKMIFKPAGPVMTIGHDSEYKESDVEIEAAVPISKKIPGSGRVKVYELSGLEQAVCTVHKGRYEDIGDAYNALMSWIQGNGYQVSGQNRELYFTDPTKVKDPSENVTEIQFPVNK